MNDQWAKKRFRFARLAGDARWQVGVCVAASLLILETLSQPAVRIDLLLTVLCCWIAYRRQAARFLFVNIAVVLATLAASEAWFSRAVRPKPSYSVEGAAGTDYFQRDPLLGHIAHPGARVVSSRHAWDGSEIYRVAYTIDARGLRVTPERDSGPAIVFFGCSFTFGEGVSDESSMPYRVGRLQPTYRAFNFGFHGFGPHQMLAAIESGKMERLITSAPRFVIFQMIPDHVRRVTNHVPFQLHGPAYGLVAGQVRLLGHFDDPSPSLLIRRLLRKSSLYARLIEPRLVTKADVELTVAVVKRARTLIADRFPDCEFHVVFWDQPLDWMSQEIIQQMHGGSLKVHLVSDLLPHYSERTQRYQIPGDMHPNAMAHDLIARYISSRIVKSAAKNDGIANATDCYHRDSLRGQFDRR